MKNKLLLLAFALMALGNIAHSQQLTIASYNIRYDNRGDADKGDGWATRYPTIANIIKFNDFDVFGAQEVLHNQLLNLADSLPGYKWLGVGRDDGKEAGEYAPIFYKTDKFKLLNNGHFWLSTDTEKPNKGWDAALPRICTWAYLQDIKTGFKFYFFNLHMDHVGVEARKQSSILVLNKIKQMAGKIPTILTGDFNVDQTNESYTLINTSGVLRDCFTLAPVKLADNGTFNSFKINAVTKARIDHIFVTKDFTVKRYGILTNTFNGHLPSDHYPVIVVADFKK
jgi:endonuclease/exonuclease/phosphatase family metal-dependent hydrolase